MGSIQKCGIIPLALLHCTPLGSNTQYTQWDLRVLKDKMHHTPITWKTQLTPRPGAFAKLQEVPRIRNTIQKTATALQANPALGKQEDKRTNSGFQIATDICSKGCAWMQASRAANESMLNKRSNPVIMGMIGAIDSDINCSECTHMTSDPNMMQSFVCSALRLLVEY